ncbi:DUF3160 domain-containing protein, partial [bacterium]|nr:DUF3160 domain-containing protein [bacterium]
NVAYFGVATRLKDETATVPDFVDSLVEAELDLIAAHQGFDFSPIFDDQPIRYKEDYSQYVPRGHYTRNDTLKTYFKSMMWYGRMMFRVEPDTTEAGKQKGKEETLLAILIVKILNELNINGEPALEIWERIYDPTVFLVGKSDDLDVYEYTPLLEEVYGYDYLSLSVEDFAEDEKLTEFIEKAKELRDPLINSSWVWDYEDAEDVTRAFRFMGQRFIPDSYMFQQLVYDKVSFYQGSDEPFTLVYSNAGPIRGFPRGLDIMAVLGSQEAEEIIRSEGDADYYGYDQQLDKLKVEFDELDDAVWAQNLYWNWLYALMPLLEAKRDGYPPFMQCQAWTYRQLYSALGSWSELRHDTILYAKQSYTSGTTGMPPPPPDFTYGYVEPNPHLFARLASLAKLMRIGLGGRGLLLDEFNFKLIDFESLLLGLKTIAEKELTNQELVQEEYDVIWTIGERLENLLTFSEELSGSITDETDEGMAVIADVHTDPNTEQVLEEGIGYPFEIYVIVKIKDNIVLTRGGGFSYYEFKHPMSDRLTDETWQEMLKSQQPPEVPSWTEIFMDNSQDFYNPDPYHAFLEVETVNNVSVDINPANPALGDSLRLKVRAMIFPDSSITAVFCSQNGSEIASVELSLLPTTSVWCGDYVGETSTSGWSEGMTTIKIIHNESILYTHWFELLEFSGINNEDNQIPTHFILNQNYPNPFNAETVIRYQLPSAVHVNLYVYNVQGQRIRKLLNREQAIGTYQIMWDSKNDEGTGVASGIYFLQIKTGGWARTIKMVLIR